MTSAEQPKTLGIRAPLLPFGSIIESATPATQLRVAVLFTKGQSEHDSDDDDLIIAAFRAVGLDAFSADLADLTSGPDGSFLELDRVSGTRKPWPLPHAALMYHGALAPPNTVTVLDQLEAAGCAVVNGRHTWQTMTDKWLFHELMVHAGVPTIPSILVHDHNTALTAMHRCGKPTVFKTPVGTEGNDVYVVSDIAQLRREVTGRMQALGGRMLAQPFIESRIDTTLEPRVLEQIGLESIGMRNDFRVMTLLTPGERPTIVAAFHRIASSSDQIVNNIAKGSREVRIDFNDLHERDQETIWHAVSSMPDAQIVGWDLIGPPGGRLVMEANSGAGLPSFDDVISARPLLEPYARLLRITAERSRARRERAY